MRRAARPSPSQAGRSSSSSTACRATASQSAAVAGTYASQGFVVAAIDIPLHGITDPASPLYQDGRGTHVRPRPRRQLRPAAAGADGVIDPSGSHIINLTSLLTSRDNLRQAALDIVQLVERAADPRPRRRHRARTSIPPASTSPALSLGGIVGTVANAMPIPTVSAYLNVPGGGVANLLRDSQALGPTHQRGPRGATACRPGTTLYEQFFRDAQTAVDAGDPLNFIDGAVAAAPGAAHAGVERHGGAELGDAAARSTRRPS